MGAIHGIAQKETQMKKNKLTENEINADITMEWLRVNRPDKWRKIQRMKLEQEHKKKKHEVKVNGE